MAILIYAFLRSWENLSHFRSRRFDFGAVGNEDVIQFKEESVKVQELAKDLDRFLMFSDFPSLSQIGLRDMFRDRNFLGDILVREIMRCFDINTVGNLIRSLPGLETMKIATSRKISGNSFWNFSLSTEGAKFKCDGDISDFVVFEPKERSRARFLRQNQVMNLDEDSNEISVYRQASFFEGIMKDILLNFGNVHYLPATRSGIMQAHRVIASSLADRSSHAGFEPIQLPTLSGIIADFLRKLILYGERRGIPWGSRWGTPWRRSHKKLTRIAESMESEILSGEVKEDHSLSIGYPNFVYRPQGAEQNIGLARSSSMVAELAPIILFLRGYVSPGDVLIIEEPEAHLHPEAQTKLAAVLAELIRNDVKVIITTHSEWLLQEISNLMREGQLRGEASESEEASSPVLRPGEVGAWLFRPGEGEIGSTVQKIEFDPIAGISPPDYEDVDLALYNRSAQLQDQLQKRNHRPASDYKDNTQDKEKS